MNMWSKKQISRFLIYLLPISILGPYVLGPFRTDHIAIYGGFPILLLVVGELKIGKNNQYLFGFLSALVALTLFSTIIQGNRFKINELENIIQPFVVHLSVLVAITKLDEDEKHDFFLKLSRVIVILLSLHTITVILALLFNQSDLFSLWHGGVTERGSVASRALSVGRLTGIFNQPSESGMAYSMALLAVYYSWSSFSFLFKYLFLGLVFIGGLLSVSKVFLLFVFILIFTIVASRSIKIINIKHSIFSSFALLVGGLVFINLAWSGLKRLQKLFSINSISDIELLISRFSGGRFSNEEESPLLTIFEDLLEGNLVLGNGLEKIPIVDSVYVEMMAYGGLFLLTMYILLNLFLIVKGLQFLFYNNKLFAVLIFSIALFLPLVGIGTITFTMNRASVLLLIMMTMALDMSNRKVATSNPEPIV